MDKNNKQIMKRKKITTVPFTYSESQFIFPAKISTVAHSDISRPIAFQLTIQSGYTLRVMWKKKKKNEIYFPSH